MARHDAFVFFDGRAQVSADQLAVHRRLQLLIGRLGRLLFRQQEAGAGQCDGDQNHSNRSHGLSPRD